MQADLKNMLMASVNGQGILSKESSQDLVPWWSFTKTLIAACALRLVEQSHVNLDDSLEGKPYTLRQALQHRAGIANYGEDMELSAFETDHGYHPGWAYHGLVMGSVAEAALGLYALLNEKSLRTHSLNEMPQCYPVGGEIPGRPWKTTAYGLGLAIGQIGMKGMAQSTRAIGHSAAGPGSVGAVYHFPDTSSQRTVAVFGPFSNEGIAEAAALQIAVGI